MTLKYQAVIRYEIHTKIFKVKDKLHTFDHNELQLPVALLYFKDELRALEYKGEYFDIGNKLDYIKANVFHGLKDSNINKDLLNYLKKIG